MTTNAEQTIKRLMQAHELHDEAALAIRLGIQASSIRVWRSRDMVPRIALLKTAEQTGYSFAWLAGEAGAQQMAPTRTPMDDESIYYLTPTEAEVIENFRALSDRARAGLSSMLADLAKARGRKVAKEEEAANAPRVKQSFKGPVGNVVTGDATVIHAAEPKPVKKRTGY